jgi:ABC-type uncharacterized transport system ATPase subunit
MKATDFAADAAQNYRRFQVSGVRTNGGFRFRDGRRVQGSTFRVEKPQTALIKGIVSSFQHFRLIRTEKAMPYLLIRTENAMPYLLSFSNTPATVNHKKFGRF